jgi:hypothetical protein
MASCFIFSATCSFFCEIKSSVFLPNKLPDFGNEFIPKGSGFFSIVNNWGDGSFILDSLVFSTIFFTFSTTSEAVSFFEILLSVIVESEKSTIFFLIQPHYFVG